MPDTLPDLLRPSLDIVFVGINPGLHSAAVGHYFASPTNRFWDALNLSGLVARPLSPETDSMALEHGIGFTDVVKKPTRSADELTAAEFVEGARLLLEKLVQYQPMIASFHGQTAYRNFMRYAEAKDLKGELGYQGQPMKGFPIHVFVTPNPSAANARFGLPGLVDWYKELKALRDKLKGSRVEHP